MKTVEIARRLDALPILVTILGIYWLTTAFSFLSAPIAPVEAFGPPGDVLDRPLNNIEDTRPSYLILSDMELLSRQSFVDISADVARISIEDFQSIDDEFWSAMSVSRRQEILKQSGLLSDEQFLSAFNSSLSNQEVLARVNQALASQVTLFDVVRDADGERYIFTGEDFVRWQPSHRFALIRIDGSLPFHCEEKPSLRECLP